MNLTPYPFAIGDHVVGVDRHIDAEVIEIRGPYSVVLSNGYVVPVELLRAACSPSMEDMLA